MSLEEEKEGVIHFDEVDHPLPFIRMGANEEPPVREGARRGAGKERRRSEELRNAARRTQLPPGLPDEVVQLSDGSVPLVTFQRGALARSRSSPAKGEEPQVSATGPCPRRGLPKAAKQGG